VSRRRLPGQRWAIGVGPRSSHKFVAWRWYWTRAAARRRLERLNAEANLPRAFRAFVVRYDR